MSQAGIPREADSRMDEHCGLLAQECAEGGKKEWAEGEVELWWESSHSLGGPTWRPGITGLAQWSLGCTKMVPTFSGKAQSVVAAGVTPPSAPQHKEVAQRTLCQVHSRLLYWRGCVAHHNRQNQLSGVPLLQVARCEYMGKCPVPLTMCGRGVESHIWNLPLNT